MLYLLVVCFSKSLTYNGNYLAFFLCFFKIVFVEDFLLHNLFGFYDLVHFCMLMITLLYLLCLD